jgi:hypothetical protein
MMMTKDVIYSEIDQIEEKYLDDLYQIITQFIQSTQPQKKPSLMAKLRHIQIDAPEDFAANLDLYLSGEKHASPNLS